MAAMVAAALPSSGGSHSWRWKIAGCCENLVSSSITEDKARFQPTGQASVIAP
jgi:hypothetical protein